MKNLTIITVALQFEGLNTVDVPEGGELLAVVVGAGYAPALAFMAERDAAMEQRTYYATRQHIEDDIPLGEYIGYGQEPLRAAVHIFEVGEAKKGRKAKKEGGDA